MNSRSLDELDTFEVASIHVNSLTVYLILYVEFVIHSSSLGKQEIIISGIGIIRELL